MRWMEMRPTATLGCELGTATRSVKKTVQVVLIMSAQKEVDQRGGKCGVVHLGQLYTAW